MNKFININIESTVEKAIKEFSGTLKEQVIPKATVAAINRTGNKVKTLAIRESSKFIGVKQKTLRDKKGIDVDKGDRARKGRYTLRITARKRGFNMIDFSPRTTASGVSAKFIGARKTLDKTFIARAKTERKGKLTAFADKNGTTDEVKRVFVRSKSKPKRRYTFMTKEGKKRTVMKEPIKAVFGR